MNLLRSIHAGGILGGLLLQCGAAAAPPDAGTAMIPVSDSRVLSSVLAETWDVSHAASEGYMDCLMSLSDVDLNLVLTQPGVITLNFDRRIYPARQAASAGPIWKYQVDNAPPSERVALGPIRGTISTSVLPAGVHRVRFVQCANPGSPRWAATDPQLSRCIGVTLPAGAQLRPSLRASAWFLPITDSIGEGAADMNTTTATWRTHSDAYTDSTRAWPAILGRLLNKSVAGYLISGIGIVRGGSGAPFGALNPQDSTGANDPWDHIFQGVPRPFTTPPDFILLCVGTNEWATDPATIGHGETTDPESADEPFRHNIERFFERVRRHPQLASTPVYVAVPFGGYKRTALQQAVADYSHSHPADHQIKLFDLAFGSPALTTTAGIDEQALFGGLTKNRPDDLDTVFAPQASDRTHPYGVATAAIGSVNAQQQLAEVMAPRLAALLKGGPPPATGPLMAGPLSLERQEQSVHLTARPATGGSAPYLYQFQASSDGGHSWNLLGSPISSMTAAIHPLEASDLHPDAGRSYRMTVADSAEPPSRVETKAKYLP